MASKRDIEQLIRETLRSYEEDLMAVKKHATSRVSAGQHLLKGTIVNSLLGQNSVDERVLSQAVLDRLGNIEAALSDLDERITAIENE